MKFSEIANDFENGEVIYRKAWDKDIVIFKQIPANIIENDIPKMTSLSPQTKEMILQNKKCIKYRHQAIEYNMSTGRASYWIPTIADLAANDWEIY